MKVEEIVALLVEYEKAHPVEQYTAYGWHAWPVLRNRLGMRLVELSGEEEFQTVSPALRTPLRYGRVAQRIVSDSLRGLWGGKGTLKEAAGGVVILGNSNRALPKGETLYNRIADPVAEAFERLGQRVSVWERGAVRLPRRRAPFWVEPPLKIRYGLARLRGRPKQLSEPAWFADYAAWASTLLGRRLSWTTYDDLRRIETASRTFERWLTVGGCRLLVVDTWYGPEPMAALLAARRLGIPTIEIEHGLHGFAYRGWTKTPAGGYEIFPDRFWVWGKEIAQDLLEANPGVLQPDRVFIGGNLWLNKWREPGDEDIQHEVERAAELTARSRKSILVTFQKNIELEDLLSRLIGDSPRDWLWLIRMRRHTGESLAALDGKLQAVGHPGVNVRQATQLPLYALLRGVNLHLTAYSTCALEALAFGVPTVLVHPTGQSLYRKYLDAGVMHYSPLEPQQVMRAIAACDHIPQEHCRLLADSVFAPREECQRNLESFVKTMLPAVPPPSDTTSGNKT